MQLGSRWQVSFSITIVALVIGIYTWFNVRSFHDGYRIPQYIFSNEGASHTVSNLGIILRPEDHIYRQPKTIQYSWNITTGIRAPDGVTKQVYLINGTHPQATLL